MDNLSSHKVQGALEPIFKKGATVLFLLEYSPDFNPIELMCSKIKSILHKLKARTHDELEAALKVALGSITYIDIFNWFAHDGYASM